MSHYCFHLADGQSAPNNHKGIDLSGKAAPRKDALTPAWDFEHGIARMELGGWFAKIIDEHGHEIDQVRIADS